NRARLAALGLNQAQVLELVTASRGGLQVRTISSDGRQIPVIVTLGEDSRNPTDMGFLEHTLVTSNGRVPVREVVAVRFENRISASRRVDGRRAIEVAVRFVSKTPSPTLRSRLEREFELPAGYTLEWRDP
ncbi:MAG: efflux RND transporter permease subunit, partial [Nannocystaceae bacterium]